MLNNLIAAVLVASQLSTGSLQALPNEVQQENEHTYIIHASGEYQSQLNTNSREALRNAYKNGNRYIEIDFNFTNDLKPICIHDWNEVVFPGCINKRPVSYDSYLDGKIYGRFSPMTLEDVANFMRLHTDLYIITDVKDYNLFFCRTIAEQYPDLTDRFIIQIYYESQYESIYDMGFENIIFTLYSLDWQTKTDTEYLVEFAKTHKLYAYTFPYELCDIDGYVEEMKKAGVPLFIHTLNDKAVQKKYFDMGIDGVYTDNTIHT